MTSTVWSQNVWSNLSTRRSQKGRRLGVLLPVRKKESAEDSPASEGSFPLKSWRFSSLFFCAAGCVVFFGHRNLRTQKKQPWEIFHRRFEKKMVKPPLHWAVTSRISLIDVDISTPKISTNDGWVFPEMLLFQYLSDIIQMTPSIEEATHLWTEMLRRITWNH